MTKSPKLILILALFFLTNLILAFYYQIYIYKGFFNSDAAITNILAQEIISQKAYYPSSWWYVNGDIWTFYKHTLAILFNLLGFEQYTIHSLVVLLFFIFTLFLIYSYLRKIGTNSEGILVALVGMSTLYSPMYAKEVLGESAYIWYFSATIGYLYAFYVLTYTDTKKTNLLAGLLIIALNIAFVAENPSRFAIYFIASLSIPLFLFYEHIEFKYKKISIFFIVGVLLGVIYRFNILSHIKMELGAENTFLIPFETLPAHIYNSFVGLINFYGVSWGEKTYLTSFDGIVYIFKLIGSIVAFFMPIFKTIKHIKELKSYEIYTITLAYTAFGVIFGIYMLSSLHADSLYTAKNNIRYIIPFVLIISLANGIVWKFYNLRVKTILLGSILISYISMPQTLNKEQSLKTLKEREEVVQTLLDNNLTKGYGPYWHSHIFTVLSNDKVEVRPLNDENDDREAGAWLSSTTWYDNKYINNNAFIIMPKQEIKDFEETTYKHHLENAKKTIELNGYKIYIFDHNPILKHKE